jgi:hypothetical protein
MSGGPERYCPACGDPMSLGATHHHLASGVNDRHLPGVASGAKKRRLERRRRHRR